MQQKIVLVGGPGTGKTSVLNELIRRKFYCKQEISRAVTKKAQEDGIEQLFLKEPLLFSEKLLEGREQQFLDASNSNKNIVFFDRGIPEIFAYLNYFKTKFPPVFIEKSKRYKYDKVFLFSPWKKIYQSDNERYETFEESSIINEYIKEAYLKVGYQLIEVPFLGVKERTDFILKKSKAD